MMAASDGVPMDAPAGVAGALFGTGGTILAAAVAAALAFVPDGVGKLVLPVDKSTVLGKTVLAEAVPAEAVPDEAVPVEGASVSGNVAAVSVGRDRPVPVGTDAVVRLVAPAWVSESRDVVSVRRVADVVLVALIALDGVDDGAGCPARPAACANISVVSADVA